MGETSGLGLWIAYGAIGLFLLLITVMFLRVAVLAAMLWLSPLASLWRRLRGKREE